MSNRPPVNEPRPLLTTDRRPAWVLVLFLVSCLLGQLHHANERHVVCDEHGEVTHEVAHAHGARASHAPHRAHGDVHAAHGDESSGPEVAADPVEGDGHHHCPIASFHREDLAPLDASGARPELAAEAPGAAEPRRVLLGAADRFRLAPKQSPPA